eukprot:SAG11_NODE_6791_length_1248_cov_1.673629_2_plen_212_part_00
MESQLLGAVTLGGLDRTERPPAAAEELRAVVPLLGMFCADHDFETKAAAVAALEVVLLRSGSSYSSALDTVVAYDGGRVVPMMLQIYEKILTALESAPGSQALLLRCCAVGATGLWRLFLVAMQDVSLPTLKAVAKISVSDTGVMQSQQPLFQARLNLCKLSHILLTPHNGDFHTNLGAAGPDDDDGEKSALARGSEFCNPRPRRTRTDPQ